MTLPERGPAVLLVVGGALATHLVRAILGAFIARGILRLVDADAAHTHPLFHPKLLALLIVRGLPAVLYRSALGSIRDVVAVGLLQATSLPFIVAATTIGLQLHAIRPANAAALVAAGLFSVIIFPIISLQLLRSSAKGPAMVPEQADVH